MEDQEMERECNEDNFLDKNNLEQFKKKNYDMSVQLIKIKKETKIWMPDPFRNSKYSQVADSEAQIQQDKYKK